MKLTAHLKRLLIECHPDRHGGDHSQMERFYRACSGSKHVKNWCPHCAEPTRIRPTARTCQMHRHTRKMLKAEGERLKENTKHQTPNTKIQLAVGAMLLLCQVAWGVGTAPNPVVQTSLTQPAGQPVTLTWDSSGNQFTVYACGSSNGSFWRIASTSSNAATVLVTNLPMFFRVTQTANGLESDFSNLLGIWQDERITVTGQHAPDPEAVFTDYPLPVYTGTNVTGMQVFRLKVDRSKFWRTQTAP